jgi:hypothetical protein
MTETYVNQPRPKFAEMPARTVMQIFILGAVLGLIAWIISAVVANYVISPLSWAYCLDHLRCRSKLRDFSTIL